MDILMSIVLSSVIFNVLGFQRYSKYAVELVSEYPGTNPDNTVSKEEAYLNQDGCLVIRVFSVSGKVLSEFTFTKDEFKITTLN